MKFRNCGNPCANVSKRSFPPTICTRDDAHYLIDCQNRGPLGLVVDQKRTIQKKNYQPGEADERKIGNEKGEKKREWKHEWFGPLLKQS